MRRNSSKVNARYTQLMEKITSVHHRSTKPQTITSHKGVKLSIYARNATEKATPRMLENKETVTTPAPLDPDVDDAGELLPVRVPEEPVALTPDDGVELAAVVVGNPVVALNTSVL